MQKGSVKPGSEKPLWTKDIEDILADGQIDEDDIILSDIVEEINIPE